MSKPPINPNKKVLNKKYVKTARKPVSQPQRHKAPSLSEAILAIIEQHYTIGYDENSNRLYAVLADGHAFWIFDNDLHEQIAGFLDDQGIEVVLQDVRKWWSEKAFKLKRAARAITVSKRIKGSPHQGEVIIDLGDKKGTLVKVTPDNQVEILTEWPSPDTVMVKLPKQAALPYPTATNSLEGVNKLTALLTQIVYYEALLFIAWLTYCLTHELDTRIMRVFLVLLGPQGSGKTSVCQHIIQRFLDPNRIGVQMIPEKFEDIAISTHQCYVPIFDNVSRVTNSLSDNLCQVATGSAILTRKLFTNSESVVTKLQSTLVFNGIQQPFMKPDLISRSLYLHFQPLSLEQRQSETDIAAYLDQHEGEIMGGLLHLCSEIMGEWPHATPKNDGRAVDFCRWLAAFDRVLDRDDSEDADTPSSSFSLEDAYASNLSQAYTTTLKNEPVAYLAHQIVLQHNGHWEGTMTQLFNRLLAAAENAPLRIHAYQLPNNAVSLGITLKEGSEVGASLQRVGVNVHHKRDRQRKVILTGDANCPGLHGSSEPVD